MGAIPFNGPKCVVRLRTSAWMETNAISIKKRISIMRKQSDPENALSASMDVLDADELKGRFINLDGLPDGLYNVVLCNLYRDSETGHLEEYDFKLVPVESCAS